MDTNAYIRTELQSRLRKRNQVVEKSKARPIAAQSILTEKEKSTFLQKFLVVCIVFMTLATLCFVVAKFMGYDVRQLMNGSDIVANKIEVSQTNQQPVYIKKDEIKNWAIKVNSRLDAIEKSDAIWNHRLWLLSIAYNENANIAKSMDKKYFNVDNRFMTVNENWKIDRIPETMITTPEQKQMLQKSLK